MRSQLMASLLLCGLTAATAQAQVTRLASVPSQSYLAPSSCGCDGNWHSYGPDCGVASPYAIDCGGCGACDSCGGVGGYFGQNIHPVNPCVCGGSLCLDVFRGIRQLLDRTLSCVIRTVFGGLHAVGCHAEGSLAALRCAATVGLGCHSCGGACCGGYGGADCGTSIISGSYWPASMDGSPTFAVPNGTVPIGPEPIEVPEEMEDPFTDDPVTTPAGPQARRIRRPIPAGYRYVNPHARVRPTIYHQPVGGNVEGNAVQRARQSSVLKASRKNNAARRRYFNGRPMTLRR